MGVEAHWYQEVGLRGNVVSIVVGTIWGFNEVTDLVIGNRPKGTVQWPEKAKECDEKWAQGVSQAFVIKSEKVNIHLTTCLFQVMRSRCSTTF